MSSSLLSVTLRDAAGVLADLLPAAFTLTLGDVVVGENGRHDVPAEDPRAVRFALGGSGSAQLVVALTGPSAALLEQGPPARELPDALTDAVSQAAAHLAPLFDGAVRLGAGDEADADAAFTATDDASVVSIRLDDAGTHRATIGLILRVTEAMLADAPVQPPPAAPAAQRPAVTPVNAEPLEFASFDQVSALPGAAHSMALLGDVEMGVTAELGRTRMTVRDVLAMTPGAILELDRAAGGPVDVVVNGTLIARGEVVVIDEEFGIRITEIIGYGEDAPGQRMQAAQ